MSSGKPTEWSPTLGASWQVVQVPVSVATPSLSLSPRTPAMLIGWVLKMFWPRAIDARAAAWALPVWPAHAS